MLLDVYLFLFFFKSFFMSCTVLCNMSIPLCNEYCCYQVKNELNTHRVPTASTANLYSSEAKPSSEDSTESDTSGCVNFLVPPPSAPNGSVPPSLLYPVVLWGRLKEETTSHSRGPGKCPILQDLHPEVSVEIGGVFHNFSAALYRFIFGTK